MLSVYGYFHGVVSSVSSFLMEFNTLKDLRKLSFMIVLGVFLCAAIVTAAGTREETMRQNARMSMKIAKAQYERGFYKGAEKLLIKLTSRPRKERTINRWKPKTKFIDGLYYSCKTFQDNIDKIL